MVKIIKKLKNFDSIFNQRKDDEFKTFAEIEKIKYGSFYTDAPQVLAVSFKLKELEALFNETFLVNKFNEKIIEIYTSKVKIDCDYLKDALKLFEGETSITISTKTNSLMKLEGKHFEVLISPRIDEEAEEWNKKQKGEEWKQEKRPEGKQKG